MVASMLVVAAGGIPSRSVAIRPRDGIILSKQALASLSKIMAFWRV